MFTGSAPAPAWGRPQKEQALCRSNLAMRRSKVGSWGAVGGLGTLGGCASSSRLAAVLLPGWWAIAACGGCSRLPTTHAPVSRGVTGPRQPECTAALSRGFICTVLSTGWQQGVGC